MQHHVVLRVVCKLLIPLILLFALYVQFHGDYGPGGGFQAGVIFGAGFILYGVVFGLRSVQAVAPPPVVVTVSCAGVLLYALVGVAGPMMGGNYLDYGVLLDDPVAGQHLGIILIELGVGLTVASTMIALFYAFSERR
ncbi:MAG TPA: Na(+)/H(+) antiporter subunit B [Gammaproteobacteria bacterium]|nr:Na(+)/H(+) antiporter subunit B [Gammaproteobacteria bacterium]